MVSGAGVEVAPTIKFGDDDITNITEGLHVGNTLSFDPKYNYVSKSVADLYTRFNVMTSRFSFCNHEVISTSFSKRTVLWSIWLPTLGFTTSSISLHGESV